jgi:HD superfamily phosphohydrolase
MRRYWGEIKDPVHGYVYITEAEKHLIDSYPFQRLHRLRQLAGVCVFRSKPHSLRALDWSNVPSW